MDQASLDFWRNHSLRFLEMAAQAERREVLRHPDGYGKATRECGDTVEIFLVVRNGRIQSASFETDGCLYSVVCANAAVHLALGKTLAQATALTPKTLFDYLETLPSEEFHCTEQAIQVLRLAVADARENDRHPWKKCYPRR